MPKRRTSYNERYTKDEIQAFILSHYVKGTEEEEIRKALKKDLDVELESPHAIRHEVRQARKQGRLEYKPSRGTALEIELSALLKARGKELERIQVVSSALTSDVAQAGAEMLTDEIKNHFSYNPESDKVEIGFAGGRTPSIMAQAVSAQLTTRELWPDAIAKRKRTIVFHSLIGNMNPTHIEVDPNSYLIYLTPMGSELRDTPFALRFNSMPAPGVVTQDEYDRLMGRDGGQGFALIKAAFQRGEELDYIVTSCAHWGSEHRSIANYLSEACATSGELKALWEETVEELNRQEVVGDIMWCPINRHGIEVTSKIRVMSMMTLSDLIAFAHPDAPSAQTSGRQRRHGRVLLLAGPCSGALCPDSKGKLISYILQMDYPPVTHLVIDSRSCRDCIDLLKSSR